ncbi:hypothetical protein CTI12_AA307100 [Artemisia annua]|uniref:GAF domain-containing protein n=1 Tax=Artemisia annua TaxID=35608 RepID=A0A2U1MWP7_ARTAN|nr:hypothetical protein CTI12_AA307100 [Artemisia annua]
MQSSIVNIMRRFDFDEKSGSLLFWKNTWVGNSWSLRLAGQQTNQDKKGLKNYRKNCLRHGEVGPGTWVQHDCFAGQAAQTGGPHQRTKQDPTQFLGQLVVPVFSQGELVGVIELVTFIPKEDYGPDLIQINRLLMDENLHG